MQTESTKRRTIPPSEQAEARVKSATEAVEKARGAADAAEEAYTEALMFNDFAASTKRKQADQAKEALHRAEDELRAAEALLALARQEEVNKADAEKLAKIAAAKARMHQLMHDAEAPIAALAEIVRKVQEAQQECLALAKREEREALHWEIDPINGRLPRVVIDRLLPHCEGFKPLSEYGLGWQDKAAGRTTWVDVLKKREAKADEVAA